MQLTRTVHVQALPCCSSSRPSGVARRVALVGSTASSAASIPAGLAAVPCKVALPARNRTFAVRATAAAAQSVGAEQPVRSVSAKFTVLIAGAGIGGLLLAVALLKKGVNVKVFERDLTAIRGEGKYRGPIQVQSNALAALEAIDPETAEEILRTGCITGDRINGLCDGVTGDWYIKFDTFHPAVSRGLPVTRVIGRLTLQQILARTVERYGGSVCNNYHAVDFEQHVEEASGRRLVTLKFEDGNTETGDLLIGADGIWSKVRKGLIGETQPSYSEYTCYTGISDFTPADIDVVGYRVFLGNGKYFVSSDVGGGKMQWYGFHKEAPGGHDEPGRSKERLLEIFGGWNDNVVDLIKATPEEDVIRRDIYDRAPIFSWWRGRVALLGDSAHAMQPNLGQGGCMAIEDAFDLGVRLSEAVEAASADPLRVRVEDILGAYQNERLVRASAIHGMARFAAIMASTYKAYLGEGLGQGLGSWLQQFKIHHPGRVSGQLVLKLTMPMVLSWVLGGNMRNLDAVRPRSCRLEDKPKAMDEELFERCMADDETLVRTARANWMLVTERPGADACCSDLKGVYLSDEPAFVGSGVIRDGVHVMVPHPAVSPQHAKVYRQGGDYYLEDLNSANGTWVNGVRAIAGARARLYPGDVVEFGQCADAAGGVEVFKVKLQHESLKTDLLSGSCFTTIPVARAQAQDQQAQSEAAQVAMSF